MDAERLESDPVRATLEKALGAQYRVLRLLGRGGMGSVYLAREEALERLVAIKVLRPDLAPTPEGRERFRREARTAAQLTHPSIVPLLGFGEADGLLYLVMGYVRGEPLSARMRREGRLGADEARRVVADVAEALDHAHRKGVVHRDVKPDNILIEDETGRALLTDFGVAKHWTAGQAMTATGVVVGTPQYMSPEQALGQGPVDGRSDLYSLGLVAYAALTGRPAFEGGSTEDVLRRRLGTEPRRLREAAPDVSEDLSEAVARCLRRDPAARWPDARGLREAVLPSGLEGERLPEPLDTLDGIVPLAIPVLVVLALIACTLLGSDRPGVLAVAALVAVASLVVFDLPILGSAVGAARRSGFAWRQIVAAACRQPKWWAIFWYPPRFRRPGDMWERLHAPFRAWRIVLTLLAVDLVGLSLLIALVSGGGLLPGGAAGPARDRLRGLGLEEATLSGAVSAVFSGLAAAFVVLVAGWAATAVLGARFMRSRGFDTYTLRRLSRTLLTAPTSDRGAWTDPRLAALLRPPRGPARAEPRTAGELVRAVAGVVERLAGPARELGAEAEARARSLRAAIEAGEADVARLSAAADVSEAGRLRDRLAALGAAPDAEAAEMRDLLAQQLVLAERMWSRLEEARAGRERALDLLRELWRAVDALVAGGAGAAGAEERLRARCAEAARLDEGAAPEAATVTRSA
ncbi:MAG TPA: protein kinase [Vicinamibacteria bacterium]|nr:protein kinase [Vicinamibacteria bacterium]